MACGPSAGLNLGTCWQGWAGRRVAVQPSVGCQGLWCSSVGVQTCNDRSSSFSCFIWASARRRTDRSQSFSSWDTSQSNLCHLILPIKKLKTAETDKWNGFPWFSSFQSNVLSFSAEGVLELNGQEQKLWTVLQVNGNLMAQKKIDLWWKAGREY